MHELPYYPRQETIDEICTKNQLLTLQFCTQHYAFFKEFTSFVSRENQYDASLMKDTLTRIGKFPKNPREFKITRKSLEDYLDTYNILRHQDALFACVDYLTVQKNMRNETRKSAIQSLVQELPEAKSTYEQIQILSNLFIELVEVICLYFSNDWIIQLYDKAEIAQVTAEDLRAYFSEVYKRKVSLDHQVR
ncbi:MAG: hypothetical protein ACK4NC_05945 [Candidatus Gracilibacteria bacterium]